MSGKRGGTVDVASLVGMGLAMELAVNNLDFENTKDKTARDRLEDAVMSIKDTEVIGRREIRTPRTRSL